MYTYFYKKTSSKSWLDVSSLVNSAHTSIVNGICTRDFKSTTNTAAFEVMPVNTHIGIYRQLLEDIVSAQGDKDQKIEVKIIKDKKIVASGYMDLASVDIKSGRSSERIKVSVRDYIVDLDKKCKANIIREGLSTVVIVEELLEMAGIKSKLLSEDNGVIVNHFVITDEDDNTFREIIDTLLFEMGNKVLYRDPSTGDYSIRSVFSKETPTTIVNYLINKSLTTSSKIWDHDGVKVKYPSVQSKDNVSVYIDSVTTKIEGEAIPAGEYYPKDGDIQPIYQAYRKEILDTDYNSKITRLQNGDLDLLYVKNTHIEVSPQTGIEYPVLPSVGLDKNPRYLPRKAQFLIRNKTEKEIILKQFDIIGTAVFRSAVNTYTLPSSSSEAVEYEASYIESEADAKVFATNYLNAKRYGATIATWSTTADAELYPIGSPVIVRHKAGNEMSQGFTVISMELSRDGGIDIRKYVAIANSKYDAYEGTVDKKNPSQSSNKTIVKDVLQFYLSTDPKTPVNGEWIEENPLEKDPSASGYLFARSFVRYSDGTEYISPYYRIGEGESASAISVTSNIDKVAYYADNEPVKEDEELIITVTGQNLKKPISVKWLNNTSELPSEGGSFKIPLAELTRVDSITVAVTSGLYIDTTTISKSFRPGKVSVYSNGTTFYYYADNVPHDVNDTINVGFNATGFKNAPTLYVDGVAVEVGPDNTYDVPVTLLQDKNSIEVYASIASYRDSLSLRKFKDVGSLNLVLSGTQFFYSADNVAHDDRATIVAALRTSGISQKPRLKIDGKEVALGETNEYVIHASDIVNNSTLNLEATCFDLTRTATIYKINDVPSITLTLTTDHFTYYADNVVKEGQPDIIATVATMGIRRGVNLLVGGVEYPLNDAGQASIPSSVLDGNLDKVTVKAAPKFVSTISASRIIAKEYMVPSLTLLTDAGQFAFDKDNKPTPITINIEYRTEGLSSAIVPRIKVQNREREWTDRKLEISYLEIITVNFLKIVADIERFHLKRELMINRVSDSKAIVPIIEYAYGASQTEPPAFAWMTYDRFVLKYGEFVLGVSDGWKPVRPEKVPEDKPYLWMRISVDGGYSFTYSPLTGPRGADGKDGMQNIYCGARADAPLTRPDGQPLVVGDYYLNIVDSAQPVPYILRENGVWSPVSATDPEWNAIASVTREDVMALGSTLKTTSAYYAYFAMLSAQNGFIDNLGTRDIVLKDGGAIQSENYVETEGIEGFRIDSEGNADFNRGTWRGAFANGLVFNAPTHVEIDKNMTQREAYKLMKKAGISRGVYNGQAKRKSQVQYPYFTLTRPAPPPRMAVSDTAFSCLDYDSSKVNFNIPVNLIGTGVAKFRYPVNSDGSPMEGEGVDDTKRCFSSFNYGMLGIIGTIIPFTATSYIVAILTYNDKMMYRYTLKGFYLLNLDGIKKLVEMTKDEIPPDLNMPNDNITISGYTDNGAWADIEEKFFDYMREYAGLIRIPEMDNVEWSAGMNFYCTTYPAVTDTANYVFCDVFKDTVYGKYGVAAISAPLDGDGVSYRWNYFTVDGYNLGDSDTLHISPLYPMNTVTVEGNTVRIFLNCWDRTTETYKTVSTEDEMIWSSSGTSTLITLTKVAEQEWSQKNIVGGITVEGRTFGIVEAYENPDNNGDRTFYHFAELTGGHFRYIPNEYVRWSMDIRTWDTETGKNVIRTKDNAVISNFLCHDGIIYGHVRGTTFKYEIATDQFTDMTFDISKVFTVEGNFISPMMGSSVTMVTGTWMFDRKGIDPYETTSAITCIDWDKKENAIFFNYKMLMRMVPDDFDVDNKNPPVTKDDQWICTPIYYYPETGKFKVFATSTAQSMLRGNQRMGSLSLLVHNNTRTFVADNGVIFLNGYDIKMKGRDITNYTIREVIAEAESGHTGEKIFEAFTVYDELSKAPFWSVFYSIYLVLSNPFFKYLDKGLDTASMPFKKRIIHRESLFPVFSRRIIVRETPEGYELCIPTIAFGPKDCTLTPFSADATVFQGWDAFINCDSMVPFLSIKKNSEEPIGATFTWDFPAQLTVTDDVGPVINMLNQFQRFTVD